MVVRRINLDALHGEKYLIKALEKGGIGQF